MYTRNVILCMVCLIAVEYWSSLVLFCVDVFYTVYRGHSMMLIGLQSRSFYMYFSISANLQYCWFLCKVYLDIIVIIIALLLFILICLLVGKEIPVSQKCHCFVLL